MSSLSKKDINEIVKQLKKGNSRAQEELYRRYFGLMMSIGMRYCENWEDAKEVVNNTFLKIFTKIEHYSGKGSFEGWMKKTMVNSSLDYIKQRKEPSVDIDDVHSYDEALFIENEAAIDIDAEELLHMVQSLPPMSRAVFNLYIMEGYKHKEISQKLNISEGTSHWHLQNARKLLKEMVNNML